MFRYKKKTLLILFVFLAAVSSIAYWQFSQPKNQPQDSSSAVTKAPEPAESELVFDKQRYSLTDPTSPWVIANKQRPLPKGFTPDNLVVPDVKLRLPRSDPSMRLDRRAAKALEKMFAAAEKAGLHPMLSSAYRSEALQRQFYNSYVARDGQAAADRYSARPGTSEHQTGLAADITNRADVCHLTICFAQQPEGKWLAAHAHTYGFIIRYPNGKESVTGYQYEPWHLRYVGPELAAEIHGQLTTMEEFFGLTND